MVELGSRALFPHLEPRAYLSHAAISPPSTLVRAAIDGVYAAYAERGVRAFGQFAEQRDALRVQLGRLIAAPASAIGFVPNTTRGVTDVALCLPWREGDRVIVSRGEFPANVTPWQRAAALFGLHIDVLPQPSAADACARWLDELKRVLPGARLLAVSAVQFQTGLMMPLAQIGELCAAHDVELFVDAVQACGVAPIDVGEMGIDYLSCGGHKWLMSVEGLGFLFVEPERAKALKPHVAGWLSHEDALDFLFEGEGHLRMDKPIRRDVRMVEGGILNAIGAAAMGASVGALLELGVDAIFAHVSAYLDALEQRLVALGYGSVRSSEPLLRSGILSLTPPPGVDMIALHAAIDPSQVCCTPPEGLLRLAPHWPNAMSEIDIVVDALEAARQR